MVFGWIQWRSIINFLWQEAFEIAIQKAVHYSRVQWVCKPITTEAKYWLLRSYPGKRSVKFLLTLIKCIFPKPFNAKNESFLEKIYQKAHSYTICFRYTRFLLEFYHWSVNQPLLSLWQQILFTNSNVKIVGQEILWISS